MHEFEIDVVETVMEQSMMDVTVSIMHEVSEEWPVSKKYQEAVTTSEVFLEPTSATMPEIGMKTVQEDVPRTVLHTETIQHPETVEKTVMVDQMIEEMQEVEVEKPVQVDREVVVQKPVTTYEQQDISVPVQTTKPVDVQVCVCWLCVQRVSNELFCCVLVVSLVCDLRFRSR
jgi:hypothetical protein